MSALATEQRVVVKLSSGHDRLEKVTVAFLTAVSELDKGKDVTLFLHRDAVPFALDGQSDVSACDGCPPLARAFAEFIDGGGDLVVCPVCFKARGLDDAALVDEACLGENRLHWDYEAHGATVFNM